MTDIINYTLTNQGKSSRVLEFIRGNSNYFHVIGKSTSWTDDTKPPTPSPELRDILEPILYKRVTIIRPARIVQCPDNDDILCNGNWFRTYRLEDILIDNRYFEVFPTHVYLQTIIRSNEYTANNFRVTGIVTNLTVKTGIPSNRQLYLPSEVSSPGLLQWVSYSTPIPRVTGKSHKLEFFLEL